MGENKKIYIVDDDRNICEIISLYLEKEGFATVKISDGITALNKIKEELPLLIILDLMLPGIDGMTLCKEVRKFTNVPIIMLTAKGDTFDKVLGLEIGADDYIVKPFDGKELVARVKAVLRRYEHEENDSDSVTYPDLSISLSEYKVKYKGENVDLTPKELELFYFLCTHPNKVFTRDQLLENVWGYEYMGDSRTVDVHIKRLREKIGDGPNWKLTTVWGVGYKFEVK
ncbi:two component transcriptional regulator, winged helix family [Thermoanaerobacterium xylanolyticum LX-11]|uniref:Stage 0 sporulation protein A homolog n=1 Tax=Thermoanaerobacterium xylanolyticum (strain ATCC 49914 / DSM 7097 / LX-11) TaxID=858215 RepID=F6BFD0_THEXL|nr:response regulator transcription factor [Thermoanaerobacterium xylanolyticum]AEF16208.1 two component transcriptional regulator, winged helix family [Thermoanaerobacterium xylanolyticum LX-11]